jgi:hypothetical protein
VSEEKVLLDKKIKKAIKVFLLLITESIKEDPGPGGEEE